MSADTPLVTIPAVSGLSFTDASSRLFQAGLTLGPWTQQPSDLITSGFVIGTDPPEGASVPEGTRVDLVVSTGHAPTGVVPDVSGLGFAEAAGVLATDGYTASLVGQASPTVEVGIVIGTSPAAGTSLDPGANVTVIVSEGWVPPFPEPPKPPKKPIPPPE